MSHANAGMGREGFLEVSRGISRRLKDMPVKWDGRAAILEMKEAGFRHWRQMEWIGWYFQFLCGRFLKGAVGIPGPRYGNVEFDGMKAIPWDFKAHAANTPHVANTPARKVIVNDSEATSEMVGKYGSVGLILALGEAEYDDGAFREWHGELKGGKSKYERERIRRGAPSRTRKTAFRLKHICFIRIDDGVLVKCGSFQRGFRNSDGSPRREKVLLDLEELGEEMVLSLDFG